MKILLICAQNSCICRTVFDVDNLQVQIAQLEGQMSAVGFWDDAPLAAKVAQKCESLKSLVETVQGAKTKIDDTGELVEIAQNDGEALDEYVAEYQSIAQIVQALELRTFLSGEYDAGDAIISIFAGAGGDDAQDWAGMLERMYLRWAESRKFATQIMTRTVGAEAGIKSVTFAVKGEYAYGYLCAEVGTHRLVRLSPFNSDNLRQTSFARIEVMPVVAQSDEIEISSSDLRIDTYRSSGAGGQSVNTTDSAVRITHIPTNTVVTCQNERSQLQNKESAMTILRGKLILRKLQNQKEERAKLRGENVSAEWGSQIRSYVSHPYKMVKDHRTGHQTAQTTQVLDGDINDFITAYLRWRSAKST